jgi:hypothetical protein
MTFDYDYYGFVFYKASIGHILNLMNIRIQQARIKKQQSWKRARQCDFSTSVLNSMLSLNALHSPSSPRFLVFYTPKICLDYTFGMITKGYLFSDVLGDYDDKLETLSLRFTLNKNEGNAIRELCYYRGNKRQRAIRVMQDPHWVLWVDGEPQPFEEGKSYEKVKGKLIRDYFTMDDMIHFATNWGCPFDQEDFWTSDQPMYVFGELENDEALADWTEYPIGF